MSHSHINQPQEIFINPQSILPKTYFDLIQKVGSAGKYQRNIFLIFLLVFLSSGSILLSTAFLFLNDTIECTQFGLLSQNCKKDVCQLPSYQRTSFMTTNQASINSIATQFGPFICEDQIYLDILSSCPYFGSFLGFLIFSYISDNFGRRTTMLICLSVATLGCLLITLGLNVSMIGIGLVLAGAGINTSTNVVFNFLGQTVENIKRQKYSIIVQISYTFGAAFVTGLYYFIGNWRIVCIIIQVIPIVFLLVVFTLYVEQTPLFLLKQSNQKALKALNRIGYINLGIKQVLKQEDIENVRRQQLITEEQTKNKVSPLALCRYDSLRSMTICSCILSYLIYTMYYGPAIIIDSIGFNIYVSSLAIQISQLIGYIPCYYYIEKVQRKKAGFFLFLVAIVSSLILALIQKPEDCDMCTQSIIQVVIIFFFRFSISAEFILFLVYIVQLYPAKVIGLGLGAVSCFGTIGSTLSPIILGVLERMQFNIMLLFLAMGFVGLSITTLLEQTYGKSLKIEIKEVLMWKNKRKTQYHQKLKSQYSGFIRSKRPQ